MDLDLEAISPSVQQNLKEVVGYLNFSSGTRNPKFFRSLNELFQWLDTLGGDQPPGKTSSKSQEGQKTSPSSAERNPTWRHLGEWLQKMIPLVAKRWEAFEDISQAAAAAHLVFEEVLPAYRRWHEDLLFHQSDEVLFQPFFIARV